MSISFSTPSTPSNKILGSLHPAYESSTHDGSIHEGDESHDSNSSQTSKPHSSESSEIPLDSTFENSINNIKTYTDFKNALKSLSYRNEVLGCEHMAPFLKILLEKKQDLLFNLKKQRDVVMPNVVS